MNDLSHVAGHRRRRALLATAGAVAAAIGAGFAWWRHAPRTPDPAAEAEFWALSLPTPAGQSLTLSKLRGTPLLVNFWATWCPPCIEELPLLNAFHSENSRTGWQVIGLAIDQVSSVDKFLNKQPVGYPVLMADAGGIALSKLLGNKAGGLPFTVVFAADGHIAARKIGKLSRQDLDSWLHLK